MKERAIAQAIIYLAVAPKSNAVYTAFNTAKQQAKDLPDYDVPPHLRNAPTNLMKELGYGAEYRYALMNLTLMRQAKIISHLN